MFITRAIVVMQETKKQQKQRSKIRMIPCSDRNMATIDGTCEDGDCLPSYRRLPSRRTPPQLPCT